MIQHVIISKKARKQLEKVPTFIVDKLDSWIHAVEINGLEVVRKIPGYHDEPLKGPREGERSIRLSKAYRAIYVIKRDKIEFAEVQEVIKHEY